MHYVRDVMEGLLIQILVVQEQRKAVLKSRWKATGVVAVNRRLMDAAEGAEVSCKKKRKVVDNGC